MFCLSQVMNIKRYFLKDRLLFSSSLISSFLPYFLASFLSFCFFLRVLLFYFRYCTSCVSVNHKYSRWPQKPEGTIESPGNWNIDCLWAAMDVLGTKLQPFKRIIVALKNYMISPALPGWCFQRQILLVEGRGVSGRTRLGIFTLTFSIWDHCYSYPRSKTNPWKDGFSKEYNEVWWEIDAKVVWNSDFLCKGSPVLDVGSIGREKVKLCPLSFWSSGNSISESTWFPVQQLACRVLKICTKSPKANSLVLELNLTVLFFFTSGKISPQVANDWD